MLSLIPAYFLYAVWILNAPVHWGETEGIVGPLMSQWGRCAERFRLLHLFLTAIWVIDFAAIEPDLGGRRVKFRRCLISQRTIKRCSYYSFVGRNANPGSTEIILDLL